MMFEISYPLEVTVTAEFEDGFKWSFYGSIDDIKKEIVMKMQKHNFNSAIVIHNSTMKKVMEIKRTN